MRRALASSPTLWLVAVLALCPAAARGQTAPVSATIFLQNPPPNVTYGPTTPVSIVVQVQNTSGSPVDTTQGFSTTDFWRRLFFTSPSGGLITNAAEGALHRHDVVLFCFSRHGVLQRPTSIPVLPIEILAGPPTPFFVQFTIDDARRFYDLTRSGRYTVRAEIPLQTFDPADPNAVIRDCDQFAGQTVVNVGGGAVGRSEFLVVSNTLEFILGQFTFVGFLSPLVNDSECTKPPCRTFRFGSTVPVKFQLLNAAGVRVGTAVATISAFQLSGKAPGTSVTSLGAGGADSGNQFRFDPVSGQYIFNLNTKALGPGVWRLDVSLGDGSTQSVQIGLQ
jgi:hypothetical protein